MRPDERLGAYRLLGLLGKGGMGEVWLAEAPAGQRVAVKALLPSLTDDPGALSRFEREIQLLARLDHPGIVRALSPLSREGDVRFYAMELVLGRSLQALLAAAGPLPPVHAVQLTCELLDALAAAHAQGIVHRDVKPANVLVDRDGRARLSDFGMARAADRSRLTQAGVVLGTPAYMSPEQAAGREADARSDLYAAGALLFELLAGRPPFTAESAVALLRQHLDVAPPDVCALVSDVPPAVGQVVRRALSKSPDERFPDAAAMRRALQEAMAGMAEAASTGDATTRVLQERVQRALAETAPAARGTPAPPAAPAPPARRRALALGALALLLALAGRALAPAAPPPAPPGDEVVVVLRDGGRLDAWLVAYDAGTRTFSCVERATGSVRALRRDEVAQVLHGGWRGEPPR